MSTIWALDKDSLGYRLKLARLRKKKKVREVAGELGVTPSYISMIENGKTNISLKVLMKLAPIYDESIESLLRTSRTNGRINYFDEMPLVSSSKTGVNIKALWTNSDPESIRPYYYQLNPGTHTELSQHSGNEFVIVLEGSMVIHLTHPENQEREVYQLEQWDSIHYPSRWAHMCKNTGDTPCVFLVIHTNLNL